MFKARSLIFAFCLLVLAVLSGCITPENRLYGVWRQSGLAGVATGLQLTFHRDGMLTMKTNLGSQTMRWRVVESKGDDYEISLQAEGSDLSMTHSLRFLDENLIETTLPSGQMIKVQLRREET